MNKLYADDALLTPYDMIAEADEAKLLAYLRKIGNKELWIYMESARIEDACAKAYELLVAKNLENEVLTAQNRKLRDALADVCAEPKPKAKKK